MEWQTAYTVILILHLGVHTSTAQPHIRNDIMQTICLSASPICITRALMYGVANRLHCHTDITPRCTYIYCTTPYTPRYNVTLHDALPIYLHNLRAEVWSGRQPTLSY